MAFLVVIIDSHSKLEYSLNYLVYRTADAVKRILLDEVQTLILQSTQIASMEHLLAQPETDVIVDDSKVVTL